MTDADVLTQARKIYQNFQDQHLAASPLAEMAVWVATGKPPVAAVLHAAGLDGSRSDTLALARRAFVRNWGFAIPCFEAVVALRAFEPLVEIGAGSGYWSAMLGAAGHDAIATDIGDGETKHGTVVGSAGSVERLAASVAVQTYADRDVFCSWPSEGEPWAVEALQLVASGQRIALVLDARRGLTGDEALQDFLASDCEASGEVALPQFPGVSDRLLLFRKL